MRKSKKKTQTKKYSKYYAFPSQGLSRALKGSQRLSKTKAREFKTLKEVKGKIFTKGNKVFQETEQKFSANLGGKKMELFSAKGT